MNAILINNCLGHLVHRGKYRVVLLDSGVGTEELSYETEKDTTLVKRRLSIQLRL